MTIQLYFMIHFDESTVFLLFHVICNAHLYKYTALKNEAENEKEKERERNLLRSDCKIKGMVYNFISFAKDKHTHEFINNGKLHYVIAYLDNKQTRFHYYTFVWR